MGDTPAYSQLEALQTEKVSQPLIDGHRGADALVCDGLVPHPVCLICLANAILHTSTQRQKSLHSYYVYFCSKGIDKSPFQVQKAGICQSLASN